MKNIKKRLSVFLLKNEEKSFYFFYKLPYPVFEKLRPVFRWYQNTIFLLVDILNNPKKKED